MLNEITQIRAQFELELRDVSDHSSLREVKVKFLGKNGLLTLVAKKISQLALEERKLAGEAVNLLKEDITREFIQIKDQLDKKKEKDVNHDALDVTLPGRMSSKGKINIISHTIEFIKNIFQAMGFKVVSGPEVDTTWYNFTALNIEENHPARQMHDTFYIKGFGDSLLRTHTSTEQVRHMLNHSPPFKIISTGKVYRMDYDATHTPMFHQLECLVVDSTTSMVNMREAIFKFINVFFGQNELSVRFRSSYFPFTEPSFEVDIRKNDGDWLEVLGCGMVNKEVFKKVNIDHSKYQGFAFGAGIERLIMLKYGLDDIREFFSNDIRWLKHYGF